MLALLADLKPKSDETAQKTIKIFYDCVIGSHFTSISGLGGSILSKTHNRCTLMYIQMHERRKNRRNK